MVDKTRASGIPENAEESEHDTQEVRTVNRKAATESIVLLKNSLQILPIKNAGRVAVVGPNAHEELYCGGGSSTVFPYYYVSAFEGIKQGLSENFPSSEVTFHQGCYKHALLPLLEAESPLGRQGVKLEFYDRDFSSDSEAKLVATTHSLTWRLVFCDSLLREALPLTYGRFQGLFKAPEDGAFEFGVITTGRAKFYVDGTLLVNNWTEQERSNHFFGG